MITYPVPRFKVGDRLEFPSSDGRVMVLVVVDITPWRYTVLRVRENYYCDYYIQTIDKYCDLEF